MTHVPFGIGVVVDGRTRRKAKGPGPEKLVQKAIVQAFAAQHRIVLIHIDSGGAGFRQGEGRGGGGYSATAPGFPDLLGVVPGSGRAVFVEVKAAGKKPTQAQVDFLAKVRAKGAIAFWADSVESALRQFGEQSKGVAA